MAQFASANLLDYPHWALGPAGALRLARNDVEDSLADRLPGIDATVERGGFVASASLRKWFPVGRLAAFGFAVGTSYGSGDYTDTYFSVTPGGAAASSLPVHEAGAGLRDVRLTAVLAQPISRRVVIGAGALYGRVLDAADRPIVADRGSRNRLIFGAGGPILFW